VVAADFSGGVKLAAHNLRVIPLPPDRSPPAVAYFFDSKNFLDPRRGVILPSRGFCSAAGQLAAENAGLDCPR